MPLELARFGVGNRIWRHYSDFMKTLAVTDARQKLGYWLKRALAGEDIVIVVDGRIVGLRPVEVISSDYALQEYGVSEAQLERAADYVEREVKAARKRGKLVRFEGKLHGTA